MDAKSCAFSIAATAALMTVSAKCASPRVSGGSSRVVRRKSTPACWSRIRNGSATTDPICTSRPSRSQPARTSANSGSFATSSTITTWSVSSALRISGYRPSWIRRLRSIGFSYAATTVPKTSPGFASTSEQRDLLRARATRRARMW